MKHKRALFSYILTIAIGIILLVSGDLVEILAGTREPAWTHYLTLGLSWSGAISSDRGSIRLNADFNV